MAQEEFESPHAEPEQRAARLRMIGTPLAATLRTFWLLISSLARLTVRWLSHAPATAVVTVVLSVLSASYLVWRDQFSVLEASPSPSPSHWWSIFSSVGAVPGHFLATALLGIGAMILAGGAAERHLGTRTWVAAALAGQVLGVTATWATCLL